MTPLDRLNDLLTDSVAKGISDIHVTGGMPVRRRLDGRLDPDETRSWSVDEVAAMAHAAINDWQRRQLETDLQVDAGYSVGGERFRINIFHASGQVSMAIRHLDNRFRSFEDLGLPTVLREIAALPAGLVLVTGATGSGKSTTLAAMIDQINRSRACHVITVEDPVEFVHESRQSLVRQRELHTDVRAFADAVRSALREDPDVLMIGEMRDLDTMRAALTAAETGHLVFSTLHTEDAVGVIERLVGSFPTDEQGVVRHRIAMMLRAVIAQRLLPLSIGAGRVPALEILKVTGAISHMIEKGRSRQIYAAMQTGAAEGMQTLDQALAALVQTGRVDLDTARCHCRDAALLDELLDGAVSGGGYGSPDDDYR